jgi:acyl-CoA synthetase (AMP-forming)/AMP-acid ligase II/aryl carrier-like protein
VAHWENGTMSHAHPVAQGMNAPEHLCVYHLLQVQAERHPDALAILAPGRAPLTYGRLHRHIDQVMQTLHALGLGRHDRIALVLPNGPEMAVAFLAVAASATCAPLNPTYSADELDLALAQLRTKALLIQAGMDSPGRAVARARGLCIIELSPLREAEAGLFTLSAEKPLRAAPQGYALPDDVALVLQTAGSTARPKMVPLTHTNICTAAHNMRTAFALVASDCSVNVMPLFHLHGLMTSVLASLVTGASTVCPPGFSAPHFFAWLEEFRPTWYSAVPTIHQAVLARAVQHRETIASCPLRLIRSGSAALPSQVREDLARVFKARVIETYGMTEASGHVTCNPLPPRAWRAGSVGVAAGPEVAIMDEAGTLLPAGETGEVVVHGPTVMQGYDDDPTANQSAFTHGWFRSGDQGYMDPEGYLCIIGRLKEIINRGGEKIAPQEVEEVLMAHPAVAQAVAFAVPEARLGEDIAAAVVLRQDATATDRDIRAFAALRLATFKVPRQVCIVDDLPHSSTGKLQRLGLAETLGLTALDRAEPVRHVDLVALCTPVEALLTGLWAQVLGVERVGLHDNFFTLGGDSLLATQLLARIREAMLVEVSFFNLFETPSVAGMARTIQTANQAEPSLPVPPLLPIPRGLVMPVSIAQERLWRLDQVLPDTPFFNMSYLVRLTGPLHVAALEQSCNEIITRHEVLRTTFATVEGRPVQVIAPYVHLTFEIVDLRDLPTSEQESEVQRQASAQAQQPFDLRHGPLLRIHLLRLGVQEHVLLLTMHYIISDGWSTGVLAHELAVLYDVCRTGAPSPLPALPIQYADFAHWQRQWRQSQAMEIQLAYWKQQLCDPLPVLELPTDCLRTVASSFRTARQSLLIPRALSEALENLSHQEGTTLFVALLAAFKMLLYGYTGQEDLRLGTLVANRHWRETEGLIGRFANTVILRTHLGGNPTCREVLQRVRATTLAAYTHQDLPFEDLVQTLERERGLDRMSLCQVMVILQNAMLRPRPLSAQTLGSLEADWSAVELDVAATTFDIVLVLRARPHGLVGTCIYKTALFETATINRMLEDFQRVLEHLISQADQPPLTFRQ